MQSQGRAERKTLEQRLAFGCAMLLACSDPRGSLGVILQMQIIACQYAIQWENPQANFDVVSRLLENEDVRLGALIALPEMFSTGFSMNVDRIAESPDSVTEAFLSDTARRFQSWIIGGLVYKSEEGRGINVLAVFGPEGNKIGVYQKNYCFSFAGEDKRYQAGSDIFVFDWNGFRVCPTICYDLRFPELFRRGVRAGATLFPVIANWPMPRLEHWTTLLKARAIENQAMVVGVNRIGSDPKLDYAGNSMIIDHRGRILDHADQCSACLDQEIFIEAVTEWRQTFPALSDMKPESP